jgi:DNA-binding CsgD family transcriptional regulator
MLDDIKNTSVQYLKNIFSELDQHKDYVFWIRNHDMSKQIYTSSCYENIWGRDPSILYDIPLMWLDYLAKDKKNCFMQQLQKRHIQGYQFPEENLVLYQVEKPNNKLSHLRDQCFKCESKTGEKYIVGISKNMKVELWHPQYENYSLNLDEKDEKIYKQFFCLLEKNFGIQKIDPIDTKISSVDTLRKYLKQSKKINFSTRELECLLHFCQGKTAKQTAREMGISFRTVETHLENIRHKTACNNKLEVVGRFSKFFSDFEIT